MSQSNILSSWSETYTKKIIRENIRKIVPKKNCVAKFFYPQNQKVEENRTAYTVQQPFKSIRIYSQWN